MDIRGLSRHAQSFLIGYLVTSEEKNKESIILETELSSARK